MISLQPYNSKTYLIESDYTFDKMEHFLALLGILTPKFNGNWIVNLISPKIKFVKDLVDSKQVPDWVEVNVYVGQKALEEIAVEFPALTPKKRSVKEEFEIMISNMKHLIDENARKTIWRSVNHNVKDLREVVEQLDKDVEEGKVINVQHVRQLVNTTRPIYAGDVLKAFLLKDPNRWKKYYKLVHDIGLDIAYYAMYKQVKILLSDKSDYLLNQDVRNYLARKVDATFICYVYVLFINSHSSSELPAILYSIDNRCEDLLKFSMKKGNNFYDHL